MANAAEDIAKIPLGIIMEGKIALPYQIAELDLSNGQFKVFYWNVGGENWNVENYSVNGQLTSLQTDQGEDAQASAQPAESPAQQATEGIQILNGSPP
jgi:hypothetical protein